MSANVDLVAAANIAPCTEHQEPYDMLTPGIQYLQAVVDRQVLSSKYNPRTPLASGHMYVCVCVFAYVLMCPNVFFEAIKVI